MTLFQMETAGQIIRKKRESLGLLIRQVAAILDIDPAILSKIERNERKPNKKIILKLSETLNIDKDELLAQYISDVIAKDIAYEKCAGRVLKLAEKKVQYLKKQEVII